MIKKLLSLLGICTFLGFDSFSAEAIFEEKAYVQLKTFFLPVLSSRGRTSNVAVTICLSVKDEKAPKKICPFVFRIRDALVQKYYARPLRFTADGVDSSKSRLRIPEALNKIVRVNLFNDYHLYKGSFSFWRRCLWDIARRKPWMCASSIVASSQKV
jgi:hypothetical protein